jgi:hypothetical protein
VAWKIWTDCIGYPIDGLHFGAYINSMDELSSYTEELVSIKKDSSYAYYDSAMASNKLNNILTIPMTYYKCPDL